MLGNIKEGTGFKFNQTFSMRKTIEFNISIIVFFDYYLVKL